MNEPLRQTAPRPFETPALRIARLQVEAVVAGRNAVTLLLGDIERLEVTATEIASLGEAVPAGIRDRASRLAAALKAEREGMAAINDRRRA